MHDAIESEIATMIREVTRNPDLPVTADTELQSLGIESLDFVELLFLMEEKFGIDLPYNANVEDENLSFKTVQSAADAIRGLIGAKGVVA